MSTLRHLEETDYQPIIRVVDDWWGGRTVAVLLQRLFFVHFRPTIFVMEDNGIIQGFLVGFRSQTTPTQAYIHFVGTHPRYRGKGIGRSLYQHFFEEVSALGCTEVLCITSPVNKRSIAFHRHMGFDVLPGDATIDGIPVTSNHDGWGGARILFHYHLAREARTT